MRYLFFKRGRVSMYNPGASSTVIHLVLGRGFVVFGDVVTLCLGLDTHHGIVFNPDY